MVWSWLCYYVCNCDLFGHLHLRVYLNLCNLVFLMDVFQFIQVIILDKSGEISGLYLSCIKPNPEILCSASHGNFLRKFLIPGHKLLRTNLPIRLNSDVYVRTYTRKFTIISQVWTYHTHPGVQNLCVSSIYMAYVAWDPFPSYCANFPYVFSCRSLCS